MLVGIYTSKLNRTAAIQMPTITGVQIALVPLHTTSCTAVSFTIF